MNPKKTIKIRLNTFETNSSSMHTVIIIKQSDYTDVNLALNEYIESIPEGARTYSSDGGIYLPVPKDEYGDSYDFGRGFGIFTDWKEKFAYVLASIQGDNNKMNSLVNMLRNKSNINIAGICIILSEYSNEQLFESEKYSSTVVPAHKDILWGEYGSVDHQSLDNLNNCLDAMNKSPEYANMSIEEKLYEIIFSNRIAIVEDSDETDSLREYIAANILDCSKIERVLTHSYVNGYNKPAVGNFESVESYIERSYDD